MQTYPVSPTATVTISAQLAAAAGAAAVLQAALEGAKAIDHVIAARLLEHVVGIRPRSRSARRRLRILTKNWQDYVRWASADRDLTTWEPAEDTSADERHEAQCLEYARLAGETLRAIGSPHHLAWAAAQAGEVRE